MDDCRTMDEIKSKPSQNFSNDEIRLAILCEFYNALHSEKSYGRIRDIKELQGISERIIDAI